MYAVVGTLFLATAGLISAWAYLQVRRPHPRRWTEREFPVLAIQLAVLMLLWSGVAFFARFLADISDRPFGLAEAALIAIFAAVLIGSAALIRATWPMLRKRRLRRLPLAARPVSGSPSFRRARDLRPRRPARPLPGRATARGKGSGRRDAA